jgi:hypothetical protein
MKKTEGADVGGSGAAGVERRRLRVLPAHVRRQWGEVGERADTPRYWALYATELAFGGGVQDDVVAENILHAFRQLVVDRRRTVGEERSLAQGDGGNQGCDVSAEVSVKHCKLREGRRLWERMRNGLQGDKE